jgi:tetratricopeptide (TPR) repeat protein
MVETFYFQENMSKFICVTTDCAIAISKAAFPTLMNCPVCQQSLIEVSENAVISDLDENLISGLPYVIAYPLKRTLLEKHAWTKINLFKDTFQNYLKYLGLIAASEFFNSSLKDKNMVALFHQTLAQPSFGSWNQYIRETLNYLIENNHNFFCPELLAYYEFIETGKKRKLFKGEIEYIDSNGDVQLKKQEATAIGMLINFRNRYLGHGLTLDEGASQKLWDEYYPIFKDLLEKLTLAIHYPMFKHEHGESYLLSSAEISPIEKVIQTPGRVWIENKDGKSMDILPFFVVPGEVSIRKEDKEQILTYESYTGKTIKFFSPEGTEKQTSGKILEQLNLLLRDKQKEQPYSPDYFTKEVFLNRITEEFKLIIDSLIAEKKVIPGVYVHREEMEIKLLEWIGARANIFFIAAEAGSGKTNLLVEIQRQYLERNLSSLLIRACRMEKQSLKEQIAYLLNLDSSLGLMNYTAISRTQAEPTFILIDGLNEAGNTEEIWQEVLELSKIFVPGSLKFVITSRANSKADTERYSLTKEDEIFIYGENKERENGLAAFVYWLTPLNMVEMKAAWEDYVKKDKNKFKPLFAFDDLATFDRSLYNQISNPLLLRLFLETYHGKKLPTKGNQHLNIWKDWLATFSEEEQIFMKLMANEVWKKGKNELVLDDLLKHEQLKEYFNTDQINAPYHRLKNLGWISRYVKNMTMCVAFTVEGALLYLFGLKLEEKQSQMTCNSICGILTDGTKLQKAGVESYLLEQAFKGQIGLISQLIDSGDRNLTICINPSLYFLKIHGAENTLKKLLEKPTENDWVFLSLLRKEIKKNQLHNLLIQFDKQIYELENILFFNQELLKLTCLESFEAEFKLLAVETILFERKFEAYKKFDKIKYLITLIEIICEISPKTAIEIYDDFFENEIINKNSIEYIKLLQNVGDAYYSLPNSFDKALEIFIKGDELINDKNSFDFKIQKLEFQNSIACCMSRKRDFIESENIFKKLISSAIELFGNNHTFFIMVYSNYADCLRLLNRFDESEQLLLNCLLVIKEVAPENTISFMNIYSSLGWNYIAKLNFEQAIDCFKKCIAITKILFGEKSIKTANFYNSLGVAYQHNNDSESALANYLIAIDLYSINESEDPNIISNLGSLYFEKKEYDIALNYLQKANHIQPNNSLTIRKIGLIYAEKKEFDKALTYLNQSENILLEIKDDSSRLELAFLYSNYAANIFENLKEYEKCIFYSKKTLSLYSELYDNNHGYVLSCIINIGRYYELNGDYDKAAEYFEQSLPKVKILGEYHPEVAISYHNIGNIWYSIKDYDKALEYFEKCSIIELKTLGENNPDVATSYYNIGSAWKLKGNYDKALENFQKGYGILRKGGFPFHIAQCYEALNDQENALDYYIQSATIRKDDPEVGLENESTKEAITNVKRLALELGKEAELPLWLKY